MILALHAALPASARHPVTTDHPRLLGTAAQLQALAQARPAAYERTARVARGSDADRHSLLLSRGIVGVVEGDAALCRQAVEGALPIVRGPVLSGHVPFGHLLAQAGLVYDLCYDQWTAAERDEYHTYLNATVDANTESETHVFHNGWYAYKWWGIGLGALATYHENERSPAILQALETEYRQRAAPALEMAGAGGGWAEGYYIHYWLYEWLFFCDVVLRLQGVDYFEMAPSFYRQRAIASVFETLPGLSQYGSRQPVSMGDGGGRLFAGDRDKQLAARQILVNRYRDDAVHHAVHAFNQTTPTTSVGNYAYKDLLWRDPSVPEAAIEDLPLSHFSPGAGHIYARSDWSEEAVHLLLKASDRFTAHQHLDVGHFAIYRGAELAGDGGHYDDFNSAHVINYYTRSIAHNTVLVHDPSEEWAQIRVGVEAVNDGGQHHDWENFNGAVPDPAAWQNRSELYDIADVLAVEDDGDVLYAAIHGTRAYRSSKMRRFTRQVAYLRPGTFVIVDRVEATDPSFRRTWLLQAATTPQRQGDHLVISNGPGRLFVQTVLPTTGSTTIADGDSLYCYSGECFLPERDTGPAPSARIEVSAASADDGAFFVHVLTATESATESVPSAVADTAGGHVTVTIGGHSLSFSDPAGESAFALSTRP